MCFAQITTCNCQRSFCSDINICAEAKLQGMIHLAKSTTTPNAGIDVVSPHAGTYFLEVYSVMEQQHIQTRSCSRCDESPDPKSFSSRTEDSSRQHVANLSVDALGAHHLHCKQSVSRRRRMTNLSGRCDFAKVERAFA